MSLRGRLTVMSALIVGVILALAAIVCFVVVRAELRGQVDEALRVQSELVRSVPFARQLRTGARPRIPQPPKRAGGAAPYTQVILRDGRLRRPGKDDVRLPVDAVDLAIARGKHAQTLRDRHVGGVHLRVVTIPLGAAGALQLGRSLESSDAVLRRLRIVLAILAVAGIAVAAAVSRLFSRRVLAPIAELTSAIAHIETTGQLDGQVRARGTDEVGRLAARFNAMLDRLEETHRALENSTDAQRQLIADASHELRTPIASLRTNIEVLLARDGGADAEHRALLADVVEQVNELSRVVSDVIELARGDQPRDDPQDLDLAAIAREALDRARRHAPSIRFDADLEPWPMSGSPERLGRALNNLLDNTAKFSPPRSAVTVALHQGELTVSDEGPGVPEAEFAHIFDRFYRGRASAQYPGSGLGLAIVKQVVDAHDGTLAAERATAAGGLRIRIRLHGGQEGDPRRTSAEAALDAPAR